MIHSFFKHLVTPGSENEDAIVAAGYGLAFFISFLDYMSGSAIQLHFLYIFPVGLVGLHSDKKIFLWGVLLYSNLLQILTIMSYSDISFFERSTLIELCVFLTFLVAYLSRIAHVTYLEAKNNSTLSQK